MDKRSKYELREPLSEPENTGLYFALVNQWWITSKGGLLLLYKMPDGSVRPQCNSDRRLAQALLDRMIASNKDYPGWRIEQIKLVLLPYDENKGMT